MELTLRFLEPYRVLSYSTCCRWSRGKAFARARARAVPCGRLRPVLVAPACWEVRGRITTEGTYMRRRTDAFRLFVCAYIGM